MKKFVYPLNRTRGQENGVQRIENKSRWIPSFGWVPACNTLGGKCKCWKALQQVRLSCSCF